MPRKKPLKLKIEQSDMEERITALKGNPERVLVRLVTSISRVCIMYAGKSITRFGISVSQAIVLSELFSHNGCSQDDLRALVKLDKGNVTRALQRLEENGFVHRKQDIVDRRVIRVYASKKTLSIERELYAIAALWDDSLTTGFTHEERETMISLLLRMEANAEVMARENDVQG